MLRLDNLLQTIDDQDNPDYVEEHGPFKSVTSHWLGVGYYFWDSLMRRAHWWGDRHYGGNYMIIASDTDYGYPTETITVAGEDIIYTDDMSPVEFNSFFD